MRAFDLFTPLERSAPPLCDCVSGTEGSTNSTFHFRLDITRAAVYFITGRQITPKIGEHCMKFLRACGQNCESRRRWLGFKDRLHLRSDSYISTPAGFRRTSCSEFSSEEVCGISGSLFAVGYSAKAYRLVSSSRTGSKPWRFCLISYEVDREGYRRIQGLRFEGVADRTYLCSPFEVMVS